LLPSARFRQVRAQLNEPYREALPAAAGIVVVESPAGDARIALPPAPVTAFVAPAPRGPVHRPIVVHGLAEYRQHFGSPAERSRLEWALAQFFANGGDAAVVVRVPRSRATATLALPGPGGALALRAVNPGPREYLRAAVDYDRIDPDDLWRFNLTVQRIRSPANPLVEEQEIYPGVSVDPGDATFVGAVLHESALVRTTDEPPAVRPGATTGNGPGGAPGYVAGGVGPDALPASPYDLIGSVTDGTGLHALDQLPRVDTVVLLSAAADGDLGPVALLAAERYCRARRALLLVDPKAAWQGVADVQADRLATVGGGIDVATCFPRLVAPDGRPVLAATGALAGWLATAPAGLRESVTLRVAMPPALALDSAAVAQLARLGVNAVAPTAPGLLQLAGGVTLAPPGSVRPEWRDLAVRQRALRIVESLARGTRWAALQPRTPATWEGVRAQAARFLADCAAAGLLAAGDDRAWYVRCDADTHARGLPLAFIAGLRLRPGGSHAAFRFEHSLPACRVTEAGWQPGAGLAD
jgi:hypothetical protein